MSIDNPYFFNQAQVAYAFNCAASHYSKGATIAIEVGQRIIERLNLIRIQPSIILDVGTGLGLQFSALNKLYPNASFLALDLALHMLKQGKRLIPWWKKQPYWICASGQHLPCPDNSISLIFANLTLAWCHDLKTLFAEWQRVLMPGGLLMFSTLGPDTLAELRTCWQTIDTYTHVHGFYDMHDIGDLLTQQKFYAPVLDMEYLTLLYPNLNKLFYELKSAGGKNLTAGRRSSLTGKHRFELLNKHYENYRNAQGLLPATFEIIYGHAWKAEQLQSASSTEVSIPLPRVVKGKI